MKGSTPDFISNSPSINRSGAWHLMGVVWMVSVFFLPASLAAQNNFDRRQNIGPTDPEQTTPPKPGLAERNNITPNPLMTLEEEQRFDVIRLKDYASSLRTQNPRPNDEKQILEGMRYRVYRMTLAKNWDDIGNLRRLLVKDIGFADDSPRARQLALTAATNFLSELLVDQPRIVTLNAILALGQLDERPANRVERTPAVAYAPAAEPLVGVVKDSNQTREAKVMAAASLGRILRDSDPARTLRDEIARVLAGELDVDTNRPLKPDEVWYLWRVVETLGLLKESRTAIGEPVAVDALWQTLLNEALPMHLRAHAARSLSQLDLDRAFDLGLIAHQVVTLAGQLTVQFNQNPPAPDWRRCYLDIYFAYRPKTTEGETRGWGLLAQAKTPALRAHQTLVEGAYQETLKLINGALGQNPPQKIPNAVLNEIADWLGKNPPSSQKLYAEAKTVEEIKADLEPDEEANTAVSRSLDGQTVGQ